MKLKSKKGFTLVELLVVIAIIGILAVVAVPALFKNINKAKVADLEADYNAIKSAVLSYYTDHNKVPDALKKDVDEGKDGLDDYMDSVPTKPSVGESYHIEESTEHGLLLKVAEATLTKDQVDKLISDIGSDKLLLEEVEKVEEDKKDKKYTELEDSINTENLYIVLINNVNM